MTMLFSRAVARLDTVVQTQQVCDSPAVNGRFHYQTDTSSDAEFFVAIGVVCMLFSAAALAGYSLYGERYAESHALPIAVRGRGTAAGRRRAGRAGRDAGQLLG